MSEKTIEELKMIADQYGIEYNVNIGPAKLQERIDSFLAQEEAEVPAFMKNVAETDTDTKELSKEDADRIAAGEARKRAESTKVVTIIDNDSRVNNDVNTATINCTNEYFDLGTRVIPLDTKVEVQQGHLDVLEEATCMYHVKTEDGNSSVPMTRKRYSVTYHDDIKQTV